MCWLSFHILTHKKYLTRWYSCFPLWPLENFVAVDRVDDGVCVCVCVGELKLLIFLLQPVHRVETKKKVELFHVSLCVVCSYARHCGENRAEILFHITTSRVRIKQNWNRWIASVWNRLFAWKLLLIDCLIFFHF